MEINSTTHLSLSKSDIAALKGLAICGMLAWHLFYCSNPLDAQFSPLVRYLSRLGDVCVSAFLFASAYGLTIQYERQKDCERLIGGG